MSDSTKIDRRILCLKFRVGVHTFWWAWAPEHLQATLRLVCADAANPESPLAWTHAAKITREMRRVTNGR